jgi:DMSO/TMAO reductase YedYZ molybdopterin-dependent catalytic subunit
VPFDLFEAATRVLPGSMVTTGIETMVAFLGLLHLSVRATAKLAEQTLAVALFFIGCMLIAVVLQLAWAWLVPSRRAVQRSGVAAGALLGAAAAFFALRFGPPAAAGVPAAAVWVVAVAVVWGGGVGWAWSRLVGAEPARPPTVGAGAVETIDRRTVLIKLGAASATLTVTGAVLGLALGRRGAGRAAAGARSTDTPALQPPETGPVSLPEHDGAVMPAPGTRPEYTPLPEFYRIDIDLEPPVIDGAQWRLPITGLVDNPQTLRLEDFYGGFLGEPRHLFITLSCISNEIGGDLISTTRWTGVPVRRVLERVGVRPDASYLVIASEDGFHEIVPLELIDSDERIMLTYLWDGKPLPVPHGFPLRIYIPDRYGMKQPKWITRLEVVDEYRPGYWVERGWSREARVKTTSVIDTVAVDAVFEQDGKRLIPVGGIAYAGDRGISKVQVQVDGGGWTDAELRPPLSDLTWVIWRVDWPFASGRHTFAVRCYDGTGALQVTSPSPSHPDGATGIDEVTRRI